ncbi:uncharacterized protein PHACADRAFT_189271, partial [Phanerochaete carnosa HHB-10118-sp]
MLCYKYRYLTNYFAQVKRFKAVGFTAAAVNADTWCPQLRQDLVDEKFRAIFASPEMLLEHQGFSKLMRTPSFTDNVLCIAIDEAHTITLWGGDFRKQFAELERLRSYAPLSVPVLATSATMTPAVLEDVQKKLRFRPEYSAVVNLGNDRPNITPIIIRTKYETTKGEELLRTIIFVKTRDMARNVWERLFEKLPDHLKSQINFMHAGRHRRTKRWVMDQFRQGHIKILVATEVAGMGLDIPDIVRIVQFMVPRTLNEWIQHLGRAGRGGEPAIVILLVEPTAFQTRKKPKPKKDDDRQPRARKRKDIKYEEVEVTIPQKRALDNGEDSDDSERDDDAGGEDVVPIPGTSADSPLEIDGEDDTQPGGISEETQAGDKYQRGQDRQDNLQNSQESRGDQEDGQQLISDDEMVNGNDKTVDNDVDIDEGAPDRDEETSEDDDDVSQDPEDSPSCTIEISGDMEYRKSSSPAPRCRRAVADRYYNNPPQQHALTAPCCDLCVLELERKDPTSLDNAHRKVFNTIRYLQDFNTVKATPPAPKQRKPDGFGSRRGERYKASLKLLQEWRDRCWTREYEDCIWGPDVLLPDKILKTLARLGHLLTVDDITKEIPSWSFADNHGQEVLDLLLPFDEEYRV